jgi:PTH2 family peptidyl-tRNA hydrolase
MASDDKPIKDIKAGKKDKILDDDYVMYILINTDLKMEKGKIASQVGHVVGHITEEIMKGIIGGAPSSDKMEDYQHYTRWSKHGHYKKIVLKATEAELKEFIATETKCRYVIDAGKTQIAPNSLTVVGFFPRPDMAEKMKKFKLL